MNKIQDEKLKWYNKGWNACLREWKWRIDELGEKDFQDIKVKDLWVFNSLLEIIKKLK